MMVIVVLRDVVWLTALREQLVSRLISAGTGKQLGLSK